jgi:hypothetical protein
MEKVSRTFGQRLNLTYMPPPKPPVQAAISVGKRPNIVRQDIGSDGSGTIASFGLAALVGAVIALIAGHYIVQEIPRDSISFWLQHPIANGHWRWALGGTVMGLAIRYLAVTD